MFDISTQSILCIIHPHTALTAFRRMVHPPEWLFIEIQFTRQSSAKRLVQSASAKHQLEPENCIARAQQSVFN